jgi:nucleoside-diphosphate-sugar epimerase
MRIVVTGASGFVGRHVVKRFTGLPGLDVVAVSRRPCTAPDSVERVLVRDYNVDTPSGDVLVHLAETNNLATVATNIEEERVAAIERLRALLKIPYRFVIYGSSAAVYGDGIAHARKATEPVKGENPYAKLKIACEELVLTSGGCVLRFANLYGPDMSAHNVMSKVLAQIGYAGVLKVWDLNPVRDYLWVEDAVSCIATMAEARKSGVYNVGSGIGTSVRQLASLILKLAGEGHRKMIATKPSYGSSSLVLDIGATRDACGWIPQISLEEGIAKMLKCRK